MSTTEDVQLWSVLKLACPVDARPVVSHPQAVVNQAAALEIPFFNVFLALQLTLGHVLTLFLFHFLPWG